MSLTDILLDPEVRDIFEATLVDSSTPEAVLQDLFGVTPDDVMEYKVMHDGPWDKPRIIMLAQINRLQSKRPRFYNLAIRVYNEGWEIVDALFNSAKNIDPAKTAMRTMKILAAKATGHALSAKAYPHAMVTASKNILTAVAVSNSLDVETADESWKLLIQEAVEEQERRQVSPKVLEAYAQIKPVKVEEKGEKHE